MLEHPPRQPKTLCRYLLRIRKKTRLYSEFMAGIAIKSKAIETN
jgi:hypothetical protein